MEHSAIVNWSECVGSYIDVEDRVDLYYVTVENLDQFTKAPVIDSVSFVYDVETELYYLRSRYYNCNWKRFNNADSIIKLNIYAYCNNSAIVCKDETGRSTRYDCAECYRMKPGDNLHYHYKNPQKFETDDYYPAQVTGNQVRIRNVNGERTGRTTDKGGNWYARPKQDKEGEITDEEFAEVLDTQGTEYYATAVSISWRYLSVKTDRFGTAKSKGGRYTRSSKGRYK